MGLHRVSLHGYNEPTSCAPLADDHTTSELVAARARRPVSFPPLLRALVIVLRRGRNAGVPHRTALLRHGRVAVLRRRCRVDAQRDSRRAARPAGRPADAHLARARSAVRPAEPDLYGIARGA